MRQIHRFPLLAAVLLAVVFSACDLDISFGGSSSSSSAAASSSASSAPAPKLADPPKEEKAESSSEEEKKAEDKKEKEGDPWDDPDYGKDWFSSKDYEDPDIPEDFELFDPWDYDDFDPAPYEGDGEYDPLEGYEAPIMPEFSSEPLFN